MHLPYTCPRRRRRPACRHSPTLASPRPADRFGGHDSRYRKGYRQSTLNVHDAATWEVKQVDDAVPLPTVAALAPQGEKREVVNANERFVGPSSIYNAPAGPAPARTQLQSDSALSSVRACECVHGAASVTCTIMSPSW